MNRYKIVRKYPRENKEQQKRRDQRDSILAVKFETKQKAEGAVGRHSS